MTERTHNKVHQIDPLTRIKHPILNGQIEVLTLLDQGHTAEVYHCRDLLDSGKQYALKLFKPSYLKKDRELKAIQNEIDILKALDNQRIVKLIEAGQDGAILNISGSVTHNLIYILLEYIPGGTLFNFCHLFGPMGEDTGRFFLIQMIEALKVIHQ